MTMSLFIHWEKLITMEVILIQDVDNLGAVNEVVKVKNGYARNFFTAAQACD